MLIAQTVLRTALGANVINTVPMTLVALAALNPVVAHTPSLTSGLVYVTAFGADLGPNIATVGSLATILWLVILRRKGLEVSSVQYFKIGILVTPPMLLTGIITIWIATLL